MTGRPRPREGKVPREFLESSVFGSLGARRDELVVGPGHGLDNAVVSLGGGRALLLTSDPLTFIPALGAEWSARLTVDLLASDLSTSGVPPQFAMLDFNLPPGLDLRSAGAYLRAVGRECERLGVAIAGGHTGRYAGSGYTVVGGGTMLSVCDEDAYVTPAMACAGDSLVVTKGAAIGATAVLAGCFPEAVESRAGPGVLREARRRLRDCSTVADAAAASGVGLRERVTSMHDATEGGVLGAASELSSACGLPVFVEAERVDVPEECAAVCGAFGLDPLTTLSEGTLLVTCKPGSVEDLRGALAGAGISSCEVGRVGAREEGEGLWLSKRGSRPRRHAPAPDRYWEAYSRAARVPLRGR